MEATLANHIKEALNTSFAQGGHPQYAEYFRQHYYDFLEVQDPTGDELLSWLANHWAADQLAHLEQYVRDQGDDAELIAGAFYAFVFPPEEEPAPAEFEEHQAPEAETAPVPDTFEQIVARVTAASEWLLVDEQPVVEEIVRNGMAGKLTSSDIEATALKFVTFARNLLQGAVQNVGAALNNADINTLTGVAKRKYQGTLTAQQVLEGDFGVKMILDAARKLAAKQQDRERMAQEDTLAQIFGVTNDELSRGFISMGHDEWYSAGGTPVIWTQGLGGCLGIFANAGDKTYGSHLMPALSFKSGNIAAKVREIVARNTPATVTIVSPSSGVEYAQQFVREFQGVGVSAANITTVVADRVAMNLRTNQVETVFRDQPVGGKGAGGAFQDLRRSK
ncbi:hypothetical protein EES43_23965 [Streptomyces sp. ADI96-02]|uniref:hypothetical protein n=1 Tax=Streptomyces sp. ADI96-02 TaxID=1522760 RepID=UPI000F54D950|nr:hypothetical protein [Streptomyces sp. ADI96-02]RPK56600.1 hypothetical protein EES43_23965 [Streptomyces sp. ADI96-02]